MFYFSLKLKLYGGFLSAPQLNLRDTNPLLKSDKWGKTENSPVNPFVFCIVGTFGNYLYITILGKS